MALSKNRPFSLAAVGFFLLLPFRVGSDELTRFHLQSCGIHHCVALQADKAWASHFQTSYAFERARISIYDLAGLRVLREIDATDVFYDFAGQKILLRNADQYRGESYYDLRREQLIRL